MEPTKGALQRGELAGCGLLSVERGAGLGAVGAEETFNATLQSDRADAVAAIHAFTGRAANGCSLLEVFAAGRGAVSERWVVCMNRDRWDDDLEVVSGANWRGCFSGLGGVVQGEVDLSEQEGGAGA